MIRPRAVRMALWLCAVALALVVVARAHYTADLSAFLPSAPNARQRMLVDQLRDGPGSRLLILAIAGADGPVRAQLSMALARRLRTEASFASVSNGESVNAQRDRQFLFEHRYLLSARVTPQRFTVDGLTAAMEESLAMLASPAGMLAKSLLPRDPTGEFLQVLDQLDRSPQPPRSAEGVWVSRDGERALLVASTRAGGSDLDAEEHALQVIRTAFAAAQRSAAAPAARSAHLLLTGPPAFAVASRATIKQEAVRLSILSTCLIASLLLAVYRSVGVLLLGLLPVTCGALAGIAAVALGFGVVHGITLAFGVTLIGESVDYSIYLFVQSRQPRAAADGAVRQQLLWRTIFIGVATSVCGFASLMPSGFPGLSQLGLYSVAGLIGAAAVTRFILPELMPRSLQVRDLTPLGEGAARLVARLRPWRALLPLLALVAAVFLYQQRTALWNRDLAALSPISADAQALDARLRADVGAPDVGDFIVISGADLQTVLLQSEHIADALDPLIASGAIGGFDTPARYLPSIATQAARRASLPDPEELRGRLRQAAARLGVRAERLQPFVEDIARARAAALLAPSDLQGTSLAAGFDALTMRSGAQWRALLPLHAAPAGSAVSGFGAPLRAALERSAPMGALLINLKSESDALYASYLSEALRLSAAGLAAIVVLLLLALRSASRVALIVAPLVLAVLVVAAALLLGGRPLTILHLIGMLLIVAVGSNYALFFDRAAIGEREGMRPLTLASLLVANAATVLGFGVLAFSQVPVLAALGSTVAPGAFLALLFAAALSRPPPRPEATG